MTETGIPRITHYTLGYYKPEPGSVSPLQLQLTSESEITRITWENHEEAKMITRMATFRPLATGISTAPDTFVDIRYAFKLLVLCSGQLVISFFRISFFALSCKAKK